MSLSGYEPVWPEADRSAGDENQWEDVQSKRGRCEFCGRKDCDGTDCLDDDDEETAL